MIIKIDDKEVYVRDADMEVAKSAIGLMLETVKNSRAASTREVQYITMLLAMYQIATEQLSTLGAENIQYVMARYKELIDRIEE